MAASPSAASEAPAAKRIEFDDPHGSLANLQEAEVTRVRTLRRRLALGADRRHRR